MVMVKSRIGPTKKQHAPESWCYGAVAAFPGDPLNSWIDEHCTLLHSLSDEVTENERCVALSGTSSRRVDVGRCGCATFGGSVLPTWDKVHPPPALDRHPPSGSPAHSKYVAE